MNTLLLFLINIVIQQQPCRSLQCLDEDGCVVDWWFIYKVHQGLQYAYMDAHTTNSTLMVNGNKDLSDSNTALAQTLNLLSSDSTHSYDYIAYNDEPPFGNPTESYGHTKGVFAYNQADQTGYFLIHSWPKFPSLDSDFDVSTASNTYAQSYLCISYQSFAVMDRLSFQLRFNKPKVYEFKNSFSGTKSRNNFTAILDKQWLSGSSIYSFESPQHHQRFTHFAKSSEWKTWRRSPPEESFCRPQYQYDALNVEAVRLDDGSHWKYTDDHSKIGRAIRDDLQEEKALVCVGDINRMYSQWTRGGGTACFEDIKLWTALNAAFKQFEICDPRKE